MTQEDLCAGQPDSEHSEYRTHARLSRAYINFSSVSFGFNFFEALQHFFDVVRLIFEIC